MKQISKQQEVIDFKTDCREAALRQSSKGATIRLYENKLGALSKNDFRYSGHLLPESRYLETQSDVSQSASAALDVDCAVYKIPRKEQRRMLKLSKSEKNAAVMSRSNIAVRTFSTNDLACEVKSQGHVANDGLVALLGPQFLLKSPELADSITSFKTPGTVPFKWEEAPGKPRSGSAATPRARPLKLPPRLENRSFSGSYSSPDLSRPQMPEYGSQYRERKHKARPVYCTPLIFSRNTEYDKCGPVGRRPRHFSGDVIESCSPKSVISGLKMNSSSSISSEPGNISDCDNGTEVSSREENVACNPISQVRNPDSSVQRENICPHDAERPFISPHAQSPQEGSATPPVKRGTSFIQKAIAIVELSKPTESVGRNNHSQTGLSKATSREPKSAIANFRKLPIPRNFEAAKLLLQARFKEISKVFQIKDQNTSSLCHRCSILHCRTCKQQINYPLLEPMRKETRVCRRSSHANLFDKNSIDPKPTPRLSPRDVSSWRPAGFYLLSPKIVLLRWRKRKIKLLTRSDKHQKSYSAA